jgi:hypothetical protein
MQNDIIKAIENEVELRKYIRGEEYDKKRLEESSNINFWKVKVDFINKIIECNDNDKDILHIIRMFYFSYRYVYYDLEENVRDNLKLKINGKIVTFQLIDEVFSSNTISNCFDDITRYPFVNLPVITEYILQKVYKRIDIYDGHKVEANKKVKNNNREMVKEVDKRDTFVNQVGEEIDLKPEDFEIRIDLVNNKVTEYHTVSDNTKTYSFEKFGFYDKRKPIKKSIESQILV